MFAARRLPPERRDDDREEVFYRTRASAAAPGSFPIQVVNISPHGFMARAEAEPPVGTALSVRLPIIGEVEAEVRWSLGGRIGCQFARAIELAPYLELLGAMARNAR